jgi:hypothetical protein
MAVYIGLYDASYDVARMDINTVSLCVWKYTERDNTLLYIRAKESEVQWPYIICVLR